MDSDLMRIRAKASSEPKLRFTSLYHHVTDKGKLLSSFIQIKSGKKAAGVDGMKSDKYAEDLQSNLENLSERLGRMGYRPQPVRRTYIAKAGSSKKRPLGIPTVEDKVVQMAVTRVLSAIYEADFLECSYGYRPARGCHDALKALGQTIQHRSVNWIVEADISVSPECPETKLKSRMLGNPLVRFREGRGWQSTQRVPRLLDTAHDFS